jgi:hypothetical protein
MNISNDCGDFLTMLNRFKLPYKMININSDSCEVVLCDTEKNNDVFHCPSDASLRVTFKDGKMKSFSIWNY